MIDYDTIMFGVLAFITLACSINVLRAREIMHSVVYLAGAFLSIACLFLLLGAEYVALVQILVYVGAVVVVILFGIMLTKREPYTDEKRSKGGRHG